MPTTTITPGSFVLAVDIGGTKLETAVVRRDGQFVEGSRQRRETGRDCTPEVFTARLESAIHKSLAAASVPISAVGIGSAGPVDLDAGTIAPHNLPGVHGLPVRSIVRAAAGGVPTTLRLDGTCIALAESQFGATRDSRVSMTMVVSTGVGGGIIVEGQPLLGGTGNAGHIGQMQLNPGEIVSAGEPSTLEALASGPSSVRSANAHGWTGTTGEQLAQGVRDGDLLALAATQRSAGFVGQAIASVATLLDLDSVALGGGFVQVRPDYIDLVRTAARTVAIFPYAKRVEISQSALGDEGPLLGAACLCWVGDSAVEPERIGELACYQPVMA